MHFELSIFLCVIVLFSSTRGRSLPGVRVKRQGTWSLSNLFPGLGNFSQPFGGSIGQSFNVKPLTDLGAQANITNLGQFETSQGGQFDVNKLAFGSQRRNCIAGFCATDGLQAGNIDGRGTFGAANNRGFDLSSLTNLTGGINPSVGITDQTGYNPFTGQGGTKRGLNLPFGIGFERGFGLQLPTIKDFSKLAPPKTPSTTIE